eukprot:gnl/TRDRNA2_/TRDRNA2_86224_c0_seq1.p1 gnl/TRDRNA2_/TRDRNA2_86224_c0~~gnl/TRDRNA2_/TRDRNA2_86224_c0_seq1.p1  ORF type:complete len:100 (+),score=28.62 gnl/TRDRNA2_/TRDRNA2_86224_c0_seq1:45-302(+)
MGGAGVKGFALPDKQWPQRLQKLCTKAIGDFEEEQLYSTFRKHVSDQGKGEVVASQAAEGKREEEEEEQEGKIEERHAGYHSLLL